MKTIINRVDASLEQYKKDHKNKPLYLVISKDEGDQLIEETKKSDGRKPDEVVTTYQDIKIERSISLKGSDFYFTNDLPETGS